MAVDRYTQIDTYARIYVLPEEFCGFETAKDGDRLRWLQYDYDSKKSETMVIGLYVSIERELLSFWLTILYGVAVDRVVLSVVVVLRCVLRLLRQQKKISGAGSASEERYFGT